MRPLSLTPRLLTIAERVPKGARAADIGTDHARLPVYLCERGVTDRVIATDISEGPLDRARRTVSAHRLGGAIELRQGSGASCISPEEVDIVIIAGMGGDTIAGILLESEWLKSKLLLLQPMTRSHRVTEALETLGCAVWEQKQVSEGYRLYTIIFAGGSYDDS